MNVETKTASTLASEVWIASAAVGVVIALQCLLINELAVGRWWLAPMLEFILLVVFLVVAAGKLSSTSPDSGQGPAAEINKSRLRAIALVLTAFIIVVNLLALVDLLRTLITGRSEVGSTLLLDAVNVWTTNVIAFALAFWCLDQGGPLAKADGYGAAREFLFPQHTISDAVERTATGPGFVDYLFLSFTTATAFSPTDTAPLTQKMKLLMMAEASVSFLTVALVAARAVNILA
jgi:uncharacterized membrane protein